MKTTPIEKLIVTFGILSAIMAIGIPVFLVVVVWRVLAHFGIL